MKQYLRAIRNRNDTQPDTKQARKFAKYVSQLLQDELDSHDSYAVEHGDIAGLKVATVVSSLQGELISKSPRDVSCPIT